MGVGGSSPLIPTKVLVIARIFLFTNLPTLLCTAKRKRQLASGWSPCYRAIHQNCERQFFARKIISGGRCRPASLRVRLAGLGCRPAPSPLIPTKVLVITRIFFIHQFPPPCFAPQSASVSLHQGGHPVAEQFMRSV